MNAPLYESPDGAKEHHLSRASHMFRHLVVNISKVWNAKKVLSEHVKFTSSAIVIHSFTHSAIFSFQGLK